MPGARLTNPTLDVPLAAGERGELVRSLDWSATPLGAPENWSPALRTIVLAHLHEAENVPLDLLRGDFLVHRKAHAAGGSHRHGGEAVVVTAGTGGLRHEISVGLLDERKISLDGAAMVLSRRGSNWGGGAALLFAPDFNRKATIGVSPCWRAM